MTYLMKIAEEWDEARADGKAEESKDDNILVECLLQKTQIR